MNYTISTVEESRTETRSESKMDRILGRGAGQGTHRPATMINAEQPQDQYFLVYIIFILNGMSVLLTWTLINMAAPLYYLMYWFFEWTPYPHPTHWGTDFMNDLGLNACSPLFALSLLALIPIPRIPAWITIAVPIFVNIINGSVLLFSVICNDPSADKMKWFYTLTFVVILVMMAANGVYQSLLYGTAADFPAEYSNALWIGNNIGGLLATFLYIFCTAGNSMTLANMTTYSPQPTAIVYYTVALFILAMAFISVLVLPKLPFYNYMINKGEEERRDRFEVKMIFHDYLTMFKQSWPELLNLFIVFFVMYSIFPTISVGIYPWGALTYPKYFVQIGTFLNFYLFCTIGSVVAIFIRIPSVKRLRYILIGVCCLLSLFIPFFMFCNFHPNAPYVREASVVFKNEWWYFVGNGLFGLVIGYLTSIFIMLAPRVCPAHVAKYAGLATSACIITGLYLGSGLSPALIASLRTMPAS